MLIGFDFDGVIIDSKYAMESAWQNVNETFCKHSPIPFDRYLEHVGKPFPVIMQLLGLEDFLPEIQEYYFLQTKLFNHKIYLYPEMSSLISFLNQSSIVKTALITSKSEIRTLQLCKLYNLNFDYIVCPEHTIRGKPFPDPLEHVNQMSLISTSNSIL